jgi:hypothetical protein
VQVDAGDVHRAGDRDERCAEGASAGLLGRRVPDDGGGGHEGGEHDAEDRQDDQPGPSIVV